MNSAERHARKQVLLTRIALARNELRRDVVQVRRAAQWPHLLRAAFGARFSGVLLGASARGDWLGTALGWLRRYRVAAALVGGAVPMLRGAGRWRRALRIGLVAGAAWLGWRVVRDRKP
jgi:hypothetical protein